jgi:hypothetical protein
MRIATTACCTADCRSDDIFWLQVAFGLSVCQLSAGTKGAPEGCLFAIVGFPARGSLISRAIFFEWKVPVCSTARLKPGCLAVSCRFRPGLRPAAVTPLDEGRTVLALHCAFHCKRYRYPKLSARARRSGALRGWALRTGGNEPENCHGNGESDATAAETPPKRRRNTATSTVHYSTVRRRFWEFSI